ncbi:MAG: DivIVA domain-containing protein [Actinobacteria bacterium]|nr:DivIVA domain-containing protein [Actinomycetota bacterium]
MKLTPLDIRHKEFSRAMRGYRDLEVDEFLDEIADEFERIFNENIDYQERLEKVEGKVEQYQNIEETLKKTLVSAQQQAEEMKQNSKKEADLILRDAELKSRSILNDSYAERQKIQRSVQALKQKQEDLKYQMRTMLETYLNILDQEGELPGEELFETAVAPETPPAAAAPEVIEASPAAEKAVEGDIKTRTNHAVDVPDDEQPGAEPVTTRVQASAPAGPAPAGPENKADPRQPYRARPLEPAEEPKESDNPFADVEVDTSEGDFKW